MNKTIRRVVACLLTMLMAAASVLMIGPQMMIIAPVALLCGIVFAIRRSFYALVCFGYLLTFGLVSTLIGRVEISAYEQTPAYVISLLIGMIGVGLIAWGFWKALPAQAQETEERT